MGFKWLLTAIALMSLSISIHADYRQQHDKLAHRELFRLILHPTNTPIPVDGFRILGGTATNPPCSDLTVRTLDQSGNDRAHTIYFKQQLNNYTAGDIDDAIGPELTCMKFQIDYKGQHNYYDSGPIRLDWDPYYYLYRRAYPPHKHVYFSRPIKRAD
jgi:hypothetical protein